MVPLLASCVQRWAVLLPGEPRKKKGGGADAAEAEPPKGEPPARTAVRELVGLVGEALSRLLLALNSSSLAGAPGAPQLAACVALEAERTRRDAAGGGGGDGGGGGVLGNLQRELGAESDASRTELAEAVREVGAALRVASKAV